MTEWLGHEGGCERVVVVTGTFPGTGRWRYVAVRFRGRYRRSFRRSGWWLRAVCALFGHRAVGMFSENHVRHDRDTYFCPCGREVTGNWLFSERGRRR